MDPTKEHASEELFPRDSVTIVRDLTEITDGPVQARDTDCCFTYIQFEKLYPGDVTATVTLGDVDPSSGNSPRTKPFEPH